MEEHPNVEKTWKNGENMGKYPKLMVDLEFPWFSMSNDVVRPHFSSHPMAIHFPTLRARWERSWKVEVHPDSIDIFNMKKMRHGLKPSGNPRYSYGKKYGKVPGKDCKRFFSKLRYKSKNVHTLTRRNKHYETVRYPVPSFRMCNFDLCCRPKIQSLEC